MREGDVVQLRPARKHLFLSNEAVVVSSSAALVLDVCDTFIRPAGLVVVIRHLFGSRLFSTVTGRDHPVHFDVITDLDGYHHGEPACAQPRVGFLSVPPRLSVEQPVKLAHLVLCDAEAGQVAVHHADSLDQSVQRPLSVLPDLVGGPPEDDDGVAVGAVQELTRPADHPEHAGVRYDSQSGPVADIRLVAQGGGVVHANHTLGAVDLFSCAGSQDVAGARHQCAVMTAQGHALVPNNGHITVFPEPLLQVGGLDGVVDRHVEGRVGSFIDIVGAVEDEESHQEEDGHKDGQPVALLPLIELEPHAF